MEVELLQVFEVARKAADAAANGGGGPADVDRCVEALTRLREMPITVKVLVETQVGKKLRSHLTKHPITKIQQVASEICEIWKQKVIEETNTKTKKSTSANSLNTVTSPEIRNVSKTDSFKLAKHNGEAVKVEKVVKKENITIEKNGQGSATVSRVKVEKTVKIENRSSTPGPSSAPRAPPKLPSMLKCNDAIRDKTRELFAEALSKVSGEASEDMKDRIEAADPIRVAVTVESVLFEKLGRSNGNQKLKYRSILFNLKDQNNPDLRRRVLIGEIKPENLINMTAEEMASDERKRQNSQIKEKALFECERGTAAKATTDQFKCGRCGQRKCTYYQMQTRSADEPMTTYVTCVNCNNHWKFC